MFLFQIGSIKRFYNNQKPVDVQKFLFQIGSIKRITFYPDDCEGKTFLFQIGSIKSPVLVQGYVKSEQVSIPNWFD